MNSSTVFGTSFDTHNAAMIARFWAAALGRQLADDTDTVNAAVPTADIATTGPRLTFHQQLTTTSWRCVRPCRVRKTKEKPCP